MAKLSLLVSEKGDNLAIITFEKFTIAKSSHLFSQTLPQSQTQTHIHRSHNVMAESQLFTSDPLLPKLFCRCPFLFSK